jgi:hypothetical protein
MMFVSSLLTRLKLAKKDGLYYISYQEDFFHSDVCAFTFSSYTIRNIRYQELFNLLLPPVVPVIRFFLSTTGVLSTVFAKSAQVLGFWRTDKGGIEDLFPEQQISSVSESLVGSEESLAKDVGGKVNQVKDEIQKVDPTQHVGPTQKEDKKLKDRRPREVGERTQREGLTRKDQVPKATSQPVPR